ncbi:MAG TPA: phosphomannose isomerase type II C-terminal cupin domain [Candidatus Aminicenantes bacterium]|nr:phosphomannose isomerase type II C-terminal cupin domain [Candidatus Aminicenantes bacterium]
MTPREERPWGAFEILYEEASLKVKRITVKGRQRLSLQSHSRRQENWVVVSGQAVVTLDDRRIPLSANEAVFIPCGARHRIENPQDPDLVFVEVQTGTYLGEDDIVRYEDDYHRAPPAGQL